MDKWYGVNICYMIDPYYKTWGNNSVKLSGTKWPDVTETNFMPIIIWKSIFGWYIQEQETYHLPITWMSVILIT